MPHVRASLKGAGLGRRVQRPISRTTALAHGNSQIQVNGSIISVVGGDSYTQIHDISVDLKSVLRAIPNFRQIYQDLLSKATPGTGIWLLKSKKFRVWLEPNGDIKILWGSGIPGAGKTILASLVIDALEAFAATMLNGRICVGFVYFRYSDAAQLTVRGVLEVLVKQSVERHPEFLPDVRDAYARHLLEDTQPTEAQLMGLLKRFTERVTTFYTLDALDEAPPEIQLDLVSKLASLNCKLFITSRPLKAVEELFPAAYSFPIVAHEEDLDLHIKRMIERSADLRGVIAKADPSISEDILTYIKEKCGGMFLHASLQVDSVCQCLSVQDVKETLESFPSRIEDAYHQTWKRILSQSPKHVLLAKSVLLWVINSRRSMKIEELRYAVSTSPRNHLFDSARLVTEATLIGACLGLVTVEEESRNVRLVHYTAKETLESLLCDSFPHPHLLLASVCMGHLTMCGFRNVAFTSPQELEHALQNDPLLRYAHEAWAFHSRQALPVPSFADQVTTFVTNCHAYPVLFGTSFELLKPLHIAIYYDFPIAFAGRHTEDPNVQTAKGGDHPLGLACWLGRFDRFQELLSLSGIIADAVNNQGWSALMYAAARGHEDAVKVLLTRPDVEVNRVDSDGRSAFMQAAFIGHTSIVALFLADPRVIINMVDNLGRSALIHAACNGQEAAPLMCAAHNGHKGTVQLLLSHPRVEINTSTAHGTTSLRPTIEFPSCAGIVPLLDFPGINVKSREGDGGMVVNVAVEQGDEAMVQMLLGVPRINVAAASAQNGRMAMSVALAKGHDNIVRLFPGFGTASALSRGVISATGSVPPTTPTSDITNEDESEDEDEGLYEDALEWF
ncbi:hypothetical protein BKA70DRAFT_1507925 [Coprinopsis sp. MPI-PUGE-AT-0042]|nr:hypothetical protein BKA70DRAFT_1507925 [Coprinopsis sp. MPI-PUGE-AT-0042]